MNRTYRFSSFSPTSRNSVSVTDRPLAPPTTVCTSLTGSISWHQGSFRWKNMLKPQSDPDRKLSAVSLLACTLTANKLACEPAH